MHKIADAINRIKGTMAIEGIVLTDEDIDLGRAILDGTVDAETAIAEIRCEYDAIAKSLKAKEAG